MKARPTILLARSQREVIANLEREIGVRDRVIARLFRERSNAEASLAFARARCEIMTEEGRHRVEQARTVKENELRK